MTTISHLPSTIVLQHVNLTTKSTTIKEAYSIIKFKGTFQKDSITGQLLKRPSKPQICIKKPQLIWNEQRYGAHIYLTQGAILWKEATNGLPVHLASRKVNQTLVVLRTVLNLTTSTRGKSTSDRFSRTIPKISSNIKEKMKLKRKLIPLATHRWNCCKLCQEAAYCSQQECRSPPN